MAPLMPTIIDTPATPIEPQTHSPTARRSRSRQFLDTLVHPRSRSRSSSGSARSPTNESVPHMVATLGLAAGTVGTDHIKPAGSPIEKDVLEGVQSFLSGIQNIIRRRETGLDKVVEEIKVDDDSRSVHSFHPITEAENNPFVATGEEDTDSETSPQDDDQEGQTKLERRSSGFVTLAMTRQQSFGEFVEDVFLYEENGRKLPCRARLDTGMTGNAVSLSHAKAMGYPIQEYDGEPLMVGDGTLFHPLGQVVLPFHFVTFRTAKTWHVEFIVFPDESPFDLCLGRLFISLAGLLKRNSEALPVEYTKYTRHQEHIKKYKTDRTDRNSVDTREKEDKRYEDRRKSRPKEKEPKKRYL